MRIARFKDGTGNGRPGVPRDDGSARLLSGDIFSDLVVSEEEVAMGKRLAPLVPANIFCVGLNYRAHARETGAPIPDHPVVFMKPTTTLTNPGDPIVLPAACEHGPEVDYEAELAVVIGKRAKDVAAEHALDYVLGYTCANDVSARRWQKHGGGGQWVRGKSFDTFCPLGPVLVTAEEIGDPQDLEISCTLNGETMQAASTSDMIFGVAELVAYLSRDTTLLPGTLILTGTPPGVGFARRPPVFLAPGDRLGVAISGIGILENRVVAKGDPVAEV
jgi:2-keto-4-pentenoate hydratase/2-oxohepta-3-ene-1,7-dioic acid hydratase in catechol pathway